MEKNMANEISEQLAGVREILFIATPEVLGLFDDIRPIIEKLGSLWVDALGTAYQRLKEEYGASDETAISMVSLMAAEIGKSIGHSLKR